MGSAELVDADVDADADADGEAWACVGNEDPSRVLIWVDEIDLSSLHAMPFSPLRVDCLLSPSFWSCLSLALMIRY